MSVSIHPGTDSLRLVEFVRGNNDASLRDYWNQPDLHRHSIINRMNIAGNLRLNYHWKSDHVVFVSFVLKRGDECLVDNKRHTN